jgi:hypothetical protein
MPGHASPMPGHKSYARPAIDRQAIPDSILHLERISGMTWQDSKNLAWHGQVHARLALGVQYFANGSPAALPPTVYLIGLGLYTLQGSTSTALLYKDTLHTI